jgi:predicted dehydrogenase
VTDQLRVGVIGLGMMGRHHARVLAGRPDVTLVGVVDPAGDRHGAASAAPVVPTLDDLLAAGVDCCTVAVPTAEHEAVGLALAAARVATLIEKPLAADVDGGRRLVDAFAAAGVLGAVGHVERYNAAVRALRARLSAGELGEIYQISTSRQGPFPDRISDVGVVKDLATHDIGLTAWVSGSSFTAVAAGTAHRAGRPHEDLVAMIGWLADGTVTSHQVNWLTPTKERQVTVTGAKGRFVADTLTADLTFYANASVPAAWDAISKFRGVSEGDMVRYAIPKPEPLAVELGEFLAAVRGEPSDTVTLAEGYRTLQVAAAVLEAADTGQVVQVVTG